jgi:hypothetical protein
MPFTLRATGSGETVFFRGTGEALLNVQDGIRLKSKIDATTELSEDGRIKRFNVPLLALTLSNWRQGTTKVGLKVRDASFSGAPESFSGDFNVSLSAGNFRGAKLAVQGVDLTLGGDIEFQNRRLAVRPKKGSLLRVTGARWLEPAARLAPLTLQIEPEAKPMIEADFEDPLSPALRHQIALSPSLLKVDALLSPNQRLSLEAHVPRVRLAGRIWGSQGRYQGEVDVAGVDVEVPSHLIALRGVDAKLRYKFLSPAKEGTASINVKEILDLRDPPFIKALRLTSNMKLLQDRFLFSGQVGESTGVLVLDFKGEQDLAGRRGNVGFKLHPLSFIPQGNQPQDFLPFLRDTITSASGKIALEGTLRWTPRNVTPNLNLLVEDLSIQSEGATLNGLNTAVKIDGLWPPSTPPGQLLSISLIDVGLPLTETVVSFRFDPKGRILVERAHLRLADGKIRTENVSIGPKGSRGKFALEVKDVDIGRLVTLSEVEGLKATGKLEGNIPLEIKEGTLIIQDGLLKAASEGGTIRYNPREVPPALRYGGERTQLVLAALRNFRYKSLNIRLNGRSDGETAVGLHLRGSNPDFFKGRPVEFNLNLSGPLAQVIQKGLKWYQLPDTIMKRLEKLAR